MISVVSIVGARPQFIKACAISSGIEKYSNFNEILVHTGQHYDENMSDIFMHELFSKKPDIHLQLEPGGHGQQTGAMLIEIEKVLLEQKPDCVIIYGDTNTTLAGALAAAKLQIPVAHIEAGLRSYNRVMPEEINRVVSDHVVDWLYTTSQNAVDNLKSEGISENKIINVGDLMYDIAMLYGDYAEKHSQVLSTLAITPGEYLLVTVHRPYNTDFPEKMRSIVEALNQLSQEMVVVFPAHPRTLNALKKYNLLEKFSNQVRVIEPVGYIDMVKLEKNAKLIITDSGGVQKEAYFHRVPCITLRPETEWIELVECGWNHLVTPDNAADIVATVEAALHSNRQPWKQIYGEGDAAKRIIEHLNRSIG